jgi:acyl transferase domain-containing protein
MASSKTVFMFSGQGSQFYQMGKPLYDANPVFRGHMQRLDEVVRGLCGRSVLEVLYAPVNRISLPFDRTSLSHPAIIMVEYALASTVMQAGVEPDLVLGTSLGSFTAAAVAGAMSIEDVLMAAIAHAEALEASCEPGAMIAILSGSDLFDENFLRDHSELTAVNFASHFCVSAPLADCAAIEAELARRDIPYQRIPVSFAFHSRWVDAAHDGFAARVATLTRRPAQLPMICCARAEARSELSETTLWEVTRQPIRFPEAIARLEREGSRRYLDLGPAGTLATFLKYLLPPAGPSQAWPILTPYGRDMANWDALMAA